MADTVVYGSAHDRVDNRQGSWGPYWSDDDTAVVIFIDSANDIRFARTENGGNSWSTSAPDASTVMRLAAWYDKETPGDAGILVHIVYLDTDGGDTVWYQTIDVATGTIATRVAVDAIVTVSTGNELNRCAITKCVNGNLLIAMSTQAEVECYRSVDAGANWTSRADVYETATEEDWVLLFPANVDAGDAVALFTDRSTSELSVKMYDDSANSWTETAIGTLGAGVFIPTVNGAIRHSDGHLLVLAADGTDLPTWDVTVDSIASPTITAKTSVSTGIGGTGGEDLFIDQQTDDVYAAHIRGGGASGLVYYKKSTDGMGAWGSEVTYTEGAGDDLRRVTTGRSVGVAGGKFQPAFYNDDLFDIFVNLNNDVDITGDVFPTDTLRQPSAVSTRASGVVVTRVEDGQPDKLVAL